MMPDDRFGGSVSVWLQERAGSGAPEYLDDILGRTARIRQRPGWTSIERWPPMDITARRTVIPSRFPLRTVALFAILALLLAAVVAVGIGSRPQRLPTPFGPAANGLIAYGATDGDIRAFDPLTGASRPLIAGPTIDQAPVFSPDGSRFLFTRVEDGTNLVRVMVAAADGSEVRVASGFTQPDSSAWSPDSTRLALVEVIGAGDTLTVYSLDGTPPLRLPVEGTLEHLTWRSTSELVFQGNIRGTYGLYVVGVDGTPPRPILPPTANEADWIQPVVSPDGSEIAYTKWVDGATIRIVDIDSGADRRVQYEGANLGDGWPTAWSPDGARLVFSRWTGTANRLAVGSVTGGRVVEMGPTFPDGTNGATGVFSPDGRHVVAQYGQSPGEIWLLDAVGGAGERVVTDAPNLGSWQRKAP
jgi:Tol biopolymer transport system component